MDKEFDKLDLLFGSKLDRRLCFSLTHYAGVQNIRDLTISAKIVKPEFFVMRDTLFIWMPTPKQDKEYVSVFQKELSRKMNSKIKNIVIDVRSNIGGNIHTFISCVYPLFGQKLESDYLHGYDSSDSIIVNFCVENGKSKVIFLDQPGNLVESIPKTKIYNFDTAKISIICNEFTMSSGEIMCLLVKKFGGIIYGDSQTGGLVNGNKKYTINCDDGYANVLSPFYNIGYDSYIPKGPILPEKNINDLANSALFSSSR